MEHNQTCKDCGKVFITTETQRLCSNCIKRKSVIIPFDNQLDKAQRMIDSATGE